MPYTKYIDPKLMALVPVLLFLGKMLQDSFHVDSAKVPFIQGVCGVVLATVWVLATSTLNGWQEILLAVFSAVVQGFLCAGAAAYADQLYQLGKQVRQRRK